MKRDIEVETITDPMALVVGARNALGSLREFLVDVDERGGVPRAMQDPRRLRLVLDHIAFAGEYLARLTVVLTTLEDPEVAALRDDVNAELMAAAAAVVFARTRIPQRQEASAEQ